MGLAQQERVRGDLADHCKPWRHDAATRHPLQSVNRRPTCARARHGIGLWHMLGGISCLTKDTSNYSAMAATKRSVFPWSSNCLATKRLGAATAIAWSWNQAV